MIVDGEVPAAAEHAGDCRGDEWCSAAVVTHPITPGQKTVTGGGGTERNRSKGTPAELRRHFLYFHGNIATVELCRGMLADGQTVFNTFLVLIQQENNVEILSIRMRDRLNTEQEC